MPSFSAWFSAHRKNITLSIVTLLVCLVLGEICLQLAYRMSMKSWLWQYNAFHVTFMMPVTDRRQYSLRPGFSDAQIGVTVNQNGMRAPASLSEPGPQQPLVVLVGDSKPFGAGVRDDETYPYYLDQLLQSKGSSLRALNAGVASYNTRQALDRFELEVVPRYRPAVVVVQAAFNDISLLTYYRDQWNPDRTWADIRFGGFAQPIKGFQKFATVYYLNRALSRVPAPGRPRTDVQYQTYPDGPMLANLRTELEAFIARSAARNQPIVLVPIDPFYYQTADLEKNPSLPLWAQNQQYVAMWKDMIKHFDDLLVELSDKYELVYFFDSRKLFDSMDRGPLYIDAFHYSPEGDRRVAEGLYAFLGQNNLLTAAPKPAAK